MEGLKSIRMVYFGSKNRFAKYILPIMLKYRKHNQWWVEPFVGGANIIDKVDGNRLGNDINFYLISLLKAIRDGWIPPEYITKEEYLDIKRNKEKYPPELVGYAGLCCTYRGKFFQGYINPSKDKRNRNYQAEQRLNLLKQAEKLKGVIFTSCDYLKLEIPENSLIYCDPPYKNRDNSWYNIESFNHDVFWDWCREQAKRGNTVFVSETESPKDFKCVFETECTIYVLGVPKKRVEKLFVYEN